MRVIHQPKSGADTAPPQGLEAAPGRWLSLDTCQRRLWIATSEDLATVSPEILESLELYTGSDAYHFMLRVATGLESQVKGETEIFGQIRAAWQNHVELLGEEARGLDRIFQRLFEDTKQIRTEYLQGFGGSSYGSLVRKLLKGRTPGPVLLVGAGQLAKAVLPYLQNSSVEIWNRRPERVPTLLIEAGLEAGPRLRTVPVQEEFEAWGRAAHVVVCVPLDSARDAERVAAWNANAGRASDGVVIHLGCSEPPPAAWAQVRNLQTLDDVFRLQREQTEARRQLVEQAENACQARADERAAESAFPREREASEILALLG